jgi:hypothetical protein
MKIKLLAFLLLSILNQPILAENFSLVSGLKTPESAIQAQDGKIYVSEINGFGKDGDGQISVIAQGKTSIFATGLDDPKGLAIIKDYLYVADKTKIIKISLADGSQKSIFVDAAGFASPPQFLNDLASDADGNLYVSDSGDILGSGKGGIIYRVNPQGEVTKLIDGAQNANILAPNGLLIDQVSKKLLEVDFTSGVLYQLEGESGKLKELAKGFGGGDGIVQTKDKWFVSDWKSGKVFSVDANGTVALLKSGYQSAADIALTIDGKYIMVPDMKAGVLDFILIQ